MVGAQYRILSLNHVHASIRRPAPRSDGSVFAFVAPVDLERPEQLYADLGCKMAVGMPFKDIATVDTLLMQARGRPQACLPLRERQLDRFH